MADIRNLTLFKFLISQRVPKGSPSLLTDTFTSHRNEPSRHVTILAVKRPDTYSPVPYSHHSLRPFEAKSGESECKLQHLQECYGNGCGVNPEIRVGEIIHQPQVR